MASRRGLKARTEQCCHLTAWSTIFEKVWNCHFLSGRRPLAFLAQLCFVEEGRRDSKEARSFFLLHKVILLVVAFKEDSSWAGVKNGGWCTCWSGGGLSPGLQSWVHSSHHMFGEGQVGSWTCTWTTLKKDSSDQICLVMVVESISCSWVNPLPWLLVWMPLLFPQHCALCCTGLCKAELFPKAVFTCGAPPLMQNMIWWWCV